MFDPLSVLAINGGSSSIKFALYRIDGSLDRTLFGKVDRIGQTGTTLTYQIKGRDSGVSQLFVAVDYASAATQLINWLETNCNFGLVRAIGHRIVHGMKYKEPMVVEQELIAELREIIPFAPEHLPGEIELIEAFRKRHPSLLQIACFDTAFHSSMPRVAQLLPIPRRYEAIGVRRYGFHGLSYAYLMWQLESIAGSQIAHGRIILAHLGNGSSVAAVRNGRSLDTTMAFTPAAGLMMGTRSGDIDPGFVSFVARSEGMTAQQFDHLANHESGMLGISETSSDMRELLARETKDVRAAEAIAMYCYQAKKWIGSYFAILEGLDTLVFAGGIGENSATVRARICEGLGCLGVELDATLNLENAKVISSASSRVTVYVINTDEERMIASSALHLLELSQDSKEIKQ